MSGNTVPSTNIHLKTGAASANNGVFEVFGTPTNNNLNGLRGVVYNTTTRPPPVTPSTFPASGSLSMTTFGGKSAFLATPTVTVANINLPTNAITLTLSSGGGTSYQVAVGTSAGDTTTTGGWVPATSGTAITTKADGTTSLAFTQGNSYYISTYSSNATSNTSSLQVQNSTAYGIANIAASVTLTLTSLSSWSISWTAPSSGIAPTFYSGGLWNEGTASWLESNANITSPYTGVAAIAQDTNYHAIIYAERPEGLYSGKISTTLKLASPAAPTTYTVSSITTSAYTPNVSGGTGSYYVILGTSSGGSVPTTLWSSGAITFTVTPGTSYYLSALSSNTATGTYSATQTSSAVGIANAATSVSLRIPGLSSWSFTWAAPSSGIAPTGYSWYLNTVNNSTSGAIVSGTTTILTTGVQTAPLVGGTTYYGLVLATRSESQSTLAASSGVLAGPTAPTNLAVSATTSSNVTFTWTATIGSGSYSFKYGSTVVTSIATTTYTLPFSALTDATNYICSVASVIGTYTSPYSSSRYVWKTTATGSGSWTSPASSLQFTFGVAGGAGGASSGSGATAGGGSGAFIYGTATVPASTTISYTIGGAGGSPTAGANGGGAGNTHSGGGGGYTSFDTGTAKVGNIIAAGGGGGGFASGGGGAYNLAGGGGAAGGSGTVAVTGGTAYLGADGGTVTEFICCNPPCSCAIYFSSHGGGGGGSNVGLGGLSENGNYNSLANGNAGSGNSGGAGVGLAYSGYTAYSGGGGGGYRGGGSGASSIGLHIIGGGGGAGGGAGSSFISSAYSSSYTYNGGSGFIFGYA